MAIDCLLPSAGAQGGSVRTEIVAAAHGATILVCGEAPVTPEATDEKVKRWNAAIGACNGACKSPEGCVITGLLRTIATTRTEEAVTGTIVFPETRSPYGEVTKPETIQLTEGGGK